MIFAFGKELNSSYLKHPQAILFMIQHAHVYISFFLK